jgi:phage terminase large subunit-like protein
VDWDDDEDEDTRKRREIQREISLHNRMREAGAFSLFQPLDFQKPWFASDRKILTLIKGNQVGGTTALVIKTVASCLGTWPLSLGGLVPTDWGQLKCREKPGKYVILSKNFVKTVPEVILPKLREFIVPDMLRAKPKRHATGVINLFQFKSGADLHIATYDQDPESFEGSLWNGVGFDEPPDRDIYMACHRGTMRTKGWLWFTMTPLKNLWVYDEIHIPGLIGERLDVAAFEAPSHLNCIQCNPGQGLIEHEEFESLFRNMTPRERKARELGVPLDISSIRYYFVTKETHVTPDLW